MKLKCLFLLLIVLESIVLANELVPIEDPIGMFEKNCNDLKYKMSCKTLGLMYSSGNRLVSKDKSKAIQFYKKACELNDAKSCKNVGIMYYNGEGIASKNVSEALKFYKKACELNDTKSCKHI